LLCKRQLQLLQRTVAWAPALGHVTSHSPVQVLPSLVQKKCRNPFQDFKTKAISRSLTINLSLNSSYSWLMCGCLVIQQGNWNFQCAFNFRKLFFLQNNFIKTSCHSSAVKHTCRILRGTVPLISNLTLFYAVEGRNFLRKQTCLKVQLSTPLAQFLKPHLPPARYT